MRYFSALVLSVIISTIHVKSQNIVLIIADDLGRNDLGCYGNTYISTPNIDFIAQKSILFANAYAAAPVCSPTRSSILTGLYPARTGITNFIDGRKTEALSPVLPAPYLNYLPYALVTLPELLVKNGYQTALIGKWHLGENTFPQLSHPQKNGFQLVKHHDYGLIPEGNSYVWIKGIDSAGKRYQLPALTDMITNDALNYIDTVGTKPFLLMVTHYNPHLPLQPKEETANKYRKKQNPYGKKINPLYAAMVDELDYSIGQIWKKLKEKNRLNNTIFIFLSDNGGVVTNEAGEEQPTTSAPFRNGKGTLYEGGIRIPFLFYHPKIAKPLKSQDKIITTDLLPTILDLCNIENPIGILDGSSFAKALKNKKRISKRPLFFHYPHFSNQGGRPTAAIIEDDYKLILSLENGTTELYNLTNDPGEKLNLNNSLPQIATKLKTKLIKWQRGVNANMPIKK